MTVFKLPDLGEGLTEAEIREWYVKVGDMVKVDQPLVAMETAKAVVDIPSPYAGKIVQLHGKANEMIKTGAPLIIFETQTKNIDQGSVVGKLDAQEKKWDESDVIIGAAKTRTRQPKVMPAARLLAQQLGINLQQVPASGPSGLITVDDVKQYSTKSMSVPLGENTETLRGVRRAMAQAMAQSHTEVVPVTIFDDADITDLPGDLDLSVLLLQSIAAACKAEPALNAWFDGKTLERKVFSEVNIGLAVDSAEGLLVPVIKNVQSSSSTTLRQQIDSYKTAVNQRSLAPADMQGATITFSNFGTIAGRYATPIIIPPTVAILGCGRARAEPIIRDDKMIAGRVLPLSLTFDHRAVTGGEATRFLHVIIKSLQRDGKGG